MHYFIKRLPQCLCIFDVYVKFVKHPFGINRTSCFFVFDFVLFLMFLDDYVRTKNFFSQSKNLLKAERFFLIKYTECIQHRQFNTELRTLE